MAFVLMVDGDAWRASVRDRLTAARQATGHPLIPVIKGHGYGLGQRTLAKVIADIDLDLGSEIDMLAVGTVHEAEELAMTLESSRQVVVLEPFIPTDRVASEAWSRLAPDGRFVRVIADPEALAATAQEAFGTRRSLSVLIEGRTSMVRFGFTPSELMTSLGDPDVHAAFGSGALRARGLSIHLPIAAPRSPEGAPAHPRSKGGIAEACAWSRVWVDAMARFPGQTGALELSVSHIDDADLAEVAAANPQIAVRLRAGSSVWLANRAALNAAGTVLAVHPLERRTHVGYRQRGVSAHGTVVVVSGGTSHGVGLSAPSATASFRQRINALGIGALDSVGRAMSPFRWAGRQRWFVEPPHQHVSMLWLPRGCIVPAVGTLMPADVRFTTSRFDAVLGLD